MHTDHINTTPTLSAMINTMSILFFYHVNTTPTLSTTVYIIFLIFFLFFPNFLAILVLITIFETVHRPCEQYPNIVNSSLH
ncbi:hypothetical protein K443DRAFT_79266, partial [Laccaria amethystina LaAM-08-1]